MEHAANRVGANRIDDPASYGLVSDQLMSPARPACGRRTANHRDEFSDLLLAQHLTRARSWFLGKSMLQTALQKPPADAAHLTRVGAERLGDILQRPVLIEKLQRSNPTPDAVGLLLPQQDLEPLGVALGQCQARERFTRCLPHRHRRSDPIVPRKGFGSNHWRRSTSTGRSVGSFMTTSLPRSEGPER